MGKWSISEKLTPYNMEEGGGVEWRKWTIVIPYKVIGTGGENFIDAPKIKIKYLNAINFIVFTIML